MKLGSKPRQSSVRKNREGGELEDLHRWQHLFLLPRAGMLKFGAELLRCIILLKNDFLWRFIMRKFTIIFAVICLMFSTMPMAFAWEHDHDIQSQTGWYESQLDFRQHHVVDLVNPGGPTTYWGSGAEQVAEGWTASGGGFGSDIGVYLQTSHARDDIDVKGGVGYSEKEMVLAAMAGTDDTPGTDTAGFSAKAMLDQELVAFEEGGDGWYQIGADGKLEGAACATAYADKGSYSLVEMAGFEKIGYERTLGPIFEKVDAYTAYHGTVSVGEVPK